MKLGEKIKEARKKKNISVEEMSKELNISISTIYRYENSSIEKIPVHIFNKICSLLDVTPGELTNDEQHEPLELPSDFKDARDAMEFLIKLPTLAAFGGYDPSTMSEEVIIEFANEILQQLKLVSYKYKK